MFKKIMLLLSFLFFVNVYANSNFYYYKNKKIFLTPINSYKVIQRSYSKQTKINYYKTKRGYIVGIGKELIVKLKDGIKPQSLVNKYPIIIKKKLLKNTYLVETNNTKKTLNINNKLALDKNVIYAIPNFIKKIHQR